MAQVGRAAIVVQVLLMSLAAGCVGNDGPDSPLGSANEAPDADAGAAGEDANGTVFGFPGSEETFNKTVQATGTIAGGPACLVGSCGDPVEHPVDDVPYGILVWLEASLAHETSGQFSGSVMLDVGMDDGTTYSQVSTWGSEEARTEAIFEIQSGGVWIEVDSAAHDGDVDYELTAVAWADPSVVHPRFPVAVPLGGERNLTVERVAVPGSEDNEPAPVRFLLFDEADALVATVDDPGPVVEVVVPDDAAGGSLVLVPGPGAASVRLSSDGVIPDATLERLSYAWEYGPSYPATGPAPVTWTYTVDRRPVAVGVYAEFEVLTIHTQVAGNVRIESPAGVVADGSWGCGMFSYCITQGDARAPVYVVDRMNPDLVAGEYAYEVDAGASNYAAIGPAVLWYKR